jgi:hypothetical protein
MSTAIVRRAAPLILSMLAGCGVEPAPTPHPGDSVVSSCPAGMAGPVTGNASRCNTAGTCCEQNPASQVPNGCGSSAWMENILATAGVALSSSTSFLESTWDSFMTYITGFGDPYATVAAFTTMYDTVNNIQNGTDACQQAVYQAGSVACGNHDRCYGKCTTTPDQGTCDSALYWDYLSACQNANVATLCNVTCEAIAEVIYAAVYSAGGSAFASAQGRSCNVYVPSSGSFYSCQWVIEDCPGTCITGSNCGAASGYNTGLCRLADGSFSTDPSQPGKQVVCLCPSTGCASPSP